jgi:hypothetical protein
MKIDSFLIYNFGNFILCQLEKINYKVDKILVLEKKKNNVTGGFFSFQTPGLLGTGILAHIAVHLRSLRYCLPQGFVINDFPNVWIDWINSLESLPTCWFLLSNARGAGNREERNGER